MEAIQYIVVLSRVSERILNYLKRNKANFRLFEFNNCFDLSDVSFREINNGSFAWRDCDNFIEGLEWEDHRQKPKTEKEKMEGCYPGRGWDKFRCRAEISGENPRGITSLSYIHCNHCSDYSPETLEGRKLVLETVRGLYELELRGLNGRIEQITTELEKQKEA